MYAVECFIKNVFFIEDVTNEFIDKNGYTPAESILKVELSYDYYGTELVKTKYFYRSTWELIESRGYFLA